MYTVRNIVDCWISQDFTANLCAINLSKAFDKVNHHAVFIKLMRRNIPVNLIEIIKNLFSGCLACIRWGNSWSTEFAIEFGLRQGSVLSPFLVDLVALCKPERKLLIVLYAKDILLLAPTLTTLRKLLHDCEHKLDLIDMAINFKKCSCLRIGQRFDVASAYIARYYGQTIQ